MSHRTHTRDVAEPPDPPAAGAQGQHRQVPHPENGATVDVLRVADRDDRVGVEYGHRWWFVDEGAGRLVAEDATAPEWPDWVAGVLYELGALEVRL